MLFTTAVVASAATVEIVMPFGPGGGTDFQGSSLEAAVTKLHPNVTVKKTYFNSCAQAMSHAVAASRENPTYLLSDIGDLIVGDKTSGARCPPLNTVPVAVTPITKLGSIPLFLCSTPKNAGNLDAVLNKPKILVGYAATTSITAMAKSINNEQWLLVPYQNAAATKTAVDAGDVDMFLGANFALPYIKEGSRCVAISSDNKTMGLPSLSAFLKKSVPNWEVTTVLFQVGDNNSQNNVMLQSARSREFTDALGSRGLTNGSLESGNLVDRITAQERLLFQPK